MQIVPHVFAPRIHRNRPFRAKNSFFVYGGGLASFAKASLVIPSPLESGPVSSFPQNSSQISPYKRRLLTWGVAVLPCRLSSPKLNLTFCCDMRLLNSFCTPLPTTLCKLSSAVCVTKRNVHCMHIPSLIKKLSLDWGPRTPLDTRNPWLRPLVYTPLQTLQTVLKAYGATITGIRETGPPTSQTPPNYSLIHWHPDCWKMNFSKFHLGDTISNPAVYAPQTQAD